jgi:catechol 2,3-dioxygenase-like lactoylglutathione lyase family enzyme
MKRHSIAYAIAQIALVFSIWVLVPAIVFFPVAMWLAKHTNFAVDSLSQAYVFAIAALWIPSGFVVDFLYRRFVGRSHSMKRLWTIVGVRDVAASFKWYQTLFGQTPSAPAHDYFGQIVDADGTVLLCLHQWGAHEHPSLATPTNAASGNGLLLFFRVDDFDAALKRARSLVTRFEEEPHVSPNTTTREFSLRDLDGYYVTVSAIE